MAFRRTQADLVGINFDFANLSRDTTPITNAANDVGNAVSLSAMIIKRPLLTTAKHNGYVAVAERSNSRYEDRTPQSLWTGVVSARPKSNPPAEEGESAAGQQYVEASKSPSSKSPKSRKSKVDKQKLPVLKVPLSELTKDSKLPMKDIEAWVHRSVESRLEEVEKRNGYIARPMNSFMLYRSAYAERTKEWCKQNNHQVVSTMSGESWPMESQEVRNRFEEWAKIERSNHQAAHPHYKFSPAKTAGKRQRGASDETVVGHERVTHDDAYRDFRNVRQRVHAYPSIATLHAPQATAAYPYYSQYQRPPSGHYTRSVLGSNGDGQARAPYGREEPHGQGPTHQLQYAHGLPVPQMARLPGSEAALSAAATGAYGLPSSQASSNAMSIATAYPSNQWPAYNRTLPFGSSYQQHPSFFRPLASCYNEQPPRVDVSYTAQTAIDPALEVPADTNGPVRADDRIVELDFEDHLQNVSMTEFSQWPAWPAYNTRMLTSSGEDTTLLHAWAAPHGEQSHP